MLHQFTTLIKILVDLAKIVPSTKIFSSAVNYKLTGQRGKRIAIVFQTNWTEFSRWENIGCATCSSVVLVCKTAGSVTESTLLKVLTYPLTVTAQGFAVTADSFDGTLSIKLII